MTKTTIATGILSAALLLSTVAALPASAQTVTTNASTTIHTHQAASLPTIISKSDAAISKRLTSLASLSTRVQALKNVSAAEKSAISTTIQTNVSGLTALKAKIDADTDVATARTDAKTITANFRIYALVIPQGYIASSADRVSTINGLMTTLSAKLQTRITADQSAGKNVTALQAALSDLNSKVSNAVSQATTANNAVASLTPDQGNKTVLASNTATIKAAKAEIKTASADLKTARDDAKTIVQDLKNLGGIKVSASSTVTQ